MNKVIRFLVLVLLIARGLPVEAQVQSVSETYVTSAALVQGKASGAGKYSYFSLQMVRPVVEAGILIGLGGSSITDANATWITGQFDGAANPHYVEFDSGEYIDILSTDGNTKTITLASPITTALAVGNRYVIRQHFTVGNLFGPNNEAGLNAGLSASSADNILLYAAKTQTMTSLYYSTASGLLGWRKISLAAAANQVIRPEQAIMIYRRTASDLILYLTGAVKSGPTQIPIYPGYNLVGTLNSYKALALKDMALYTGNNTTGVAAGINSTEADNLMVLKSDGSVTNFYYATSFNPPGWFKGFTRSDTVGVAPGAAFFVYRKNNRPAFVWSIPAE